MVSDFRPRGLIVDDDEDFVKSVRFVLDKLGVDLISTHDPSEFLTQLEIHELNFCLIDLNIGETVQGFDLIAAVRRKLGANIPVIMLSANSDMTAITHAIEQGANDYILKPLNRTSLSSKLAPYVNTLELSQSAGVLTKISEEEGKCVLDFSVEVVGVDELGIILQSPNLIAKGTAIQISGAIVEEVTGEVGPQLVSVVETTMKPGAGYLAYCEFGSKSEGVTSQIRTWLAKKTKASPAGTRAP